MIDFKKTIKNLHNKYPELTIDQLIGIIESIELIEQPSILNTPRDIPTTLPNRTGNVPETFITWNSNKTCK